MGKKNHSLDQSGWGAWVVSGGAVLAVSIPGVVALGITSAFVPILAGAVAYFYGARSMAPSVISSEIILRMCGFTVLMVSLPIALALGISWAITQQEQLGWAAIASGGLVFGGLGFAFGSE